MKMPHRAWSLALLLLAVPVAGQAQSRNEEGPKEEDYKLRVSYRYFLPTLTGNLRNSSPSVTGTLLDLEGLGLEDERTWVGAGAIQFKRGHKIRGFYTPIEYKGTTVPREVFNFGGNRYIPGASISSSVKGTYYGGEYEWDVLKKPKGFVGLLIGGRYFDVDSRIVQAISGFADTETTQIPMPFLGLTARYYTGRLSIEVEGGGMKTSQQRQVWEGEATIRLHISDRLGAGAGYRITTFKGEKDEDFIDFRTGGLQFGIELSL